MCRDCHGTLVNPDQAPSLAQGEGEMDVDGEMDPDGAFGSMVDSIEVR